jgi:condensin complex subunit 1
MDDDERVEWNLRKYYDLYIQDPALIPCSEADPELLEAEENPEALTNAQINQILDPIIDSLAANPDAISKASVLDTLQCLLK